MDYPIFPDEVAVAINFLSNHAALSFWQPVTVAGDLKGFEGGSRWVEIVATGGTESNPYRVASPRVDVNVYAESRHAAKRLAQTCSAILKGMKNHVTTEAVIIGVECSTPIDLTDPVNNNHRFVFDATIHVRPA